LVSSLQARLDILMAEADEISESNEASGARHAILTPTSESSTYITLRLPTRVFFPVQVLDPFCSIQHDARWLEIVMDTGPLLSVGLACSFISINCVKSKQAKQLMLVFCAFRRLCCHPCSLSACLCLLECQRIVGKVSVACLQDTLSFCDYLASGESMADATCRLQPLLRKQADLSQVSLRSVSLETAHIKCTLHVSCFKHLSQKYHAPLPLTS